MTQLLNYRINKKYNIVFAVCNLLSEAEIHVDILSIHTQDYMRTYYKKHNSFLKKWSAKNTKTLFQPDTTAGESIWLKSADTPGVWAMS